MDAVTGMAVNGVLILTIDLNKNCHEYCHYGKMCRYVEGSNGMDPDECAMYYKLDDLMNDARDIEQEQRRSAGLEEWEGWDDL